MGWHTNGFYEVLTSMAFYVHKSSSITLDDDVTFTVCSVSVSENAGHYN